MDNKNQTNNNFDLMKTIENELEEEFDIHNIHSIMKYIRVHYFKFLLLLFAIIIIIVVDYITSINSTLFSMPSPIIGVPAANTGTPSKPKVKTNKKSKK